MKGTVESVVEPFGQKFSEKTQKHYAAMKAKVRLEDFNVVTVLVFEEKAVGDELELEKKGDYWNVVSKRQMADNQKHDEIMDALRKLYKKVEELEKAVQVERI